MLQTSMGLSKLITGLNALMSLSNQQSGEIWLVKVRRPQAWRM